MIARLQTHQQIQYIIAESAQLTRGTSGKESPTKLQRIDVHEEGKIEGLDPEMQRKTQ